MVFLSPLKIPPNITHMWFRPQDLPETRFSTLFHPQTINSAPKHHVQQILLKFQVETKDSIILHIRSQMLPNFHIKLLSPQVLLFGKSSPTPPWLNILIILGSSIFISPLAKQKPCEKPNQCGGGWIRGFASMVLQAAPPPCDFE